jgi:nucleoside-diphosphate-sugar epimerase
MTTELNTALVVGSTGITGLNLATHLVSKGWQVYGLARNPKEMPGVIPVAADLQDAAALKAALADINPTHVSSAHGYGRKLKPKTCASTATWCETSSRHWKANRSSTRR